VNFDNHTVTEGSGSNHPGLIRTGGSFSNPGIAGAENHGSHNHAKRGAGYGGDRFGQVTDKTRGTNFDGAGSDHGGSTGALRSGLKSSAGLKTRPGFLGAGGFHGGGGSGLLAGGKQRKSGSSSVL
jgi:hypothetical protein